VNIFPFSLPTQLDSHSFFNKKGSQDAGQTVLASNQEVNSLVSALGSTLNLKRHVAGSLEKKEVPLSHH